MSQTDKPPLTTTTSIVPAMIIVIVAVVLLGAFLLLDVIANPSVHTPTTAVPIVVGGLTTQRGGAALIGCQQPGTPPGNIAPALILPSTTRATGPVQNTNGGAGDYDCSRSLATTAPSSQILGFYSSHLEALGWGLFSRGTTNGLPQLLFQKAGSDTFYWVVGVTITARHGSTTLWSYRIYQNSSTF
ncbi:MAG: hypothetical protein ACP5PB_05100 [Acidimicrobiales bacterium]